MLLARADPQAEPPMSAQNGHRRRGSKSRRAFVGKTSDATLVSVGDALGERAVEQLLLLLLLRPDHRGHTVTRTCSISFKGEGHCHQRCPPLLFLRRSVVEGASSRNGAQW